MFVLLVGMTLTAAAVQSVGADDVRVVPGQVVVKLVDAQRASAVRPSADEVRTRLGAATARALLPGGARWSERLAAARRRHPARSRRARDVGVLPDMSAVYVLTVPAGRRTNDFCDQARRDPSVAWCEPDAVAHVTLVPDDPYYSSSGSWGQAFRDQWALPLVGAEPAWDVSTGSGTLIAVVDTGISRARELKFGRQVWRNDVERHGVRGADDDGNGVADDTDGWSFVTCEGIVSDGTCLKTVQPRGRLHDVRDLYGHGTAVASVIAAATDDGRGMAGLAFGARVIAVRALNAFGQGVASELAAAIVYAAESGADVINMSWGFPLFAGLPFPQVIADAIAVARGLGVVLVAAAGNDGTQLDPRIAEIPAGLPGVIAVSASNPGDQITSFSTFGSWVSLAAPGGGPEDVYPPSGTDPLDGILTIGVRSSALYRGRPGNVVAPGYLRLAGTSFAAPHVAAAAALVLARHPAFTVDQVEQVLRETATDIGTPGRDVRSGYGRVDVARAVAVDSMPVARLTAPAWDARVRAPVDVTGTATSPEGRLAGWRLLLGPSGAAPAEIARGTAELRDGVFASVDPATLPAGQAQTLRLEVTDTTGSVATDMLVFTPLPAPPVPPLTFHKVFDTGGFVEAHGGDPLWDAAVADLDEDGRQEIIFCTCPSNAECPTVHIWENSGDNEYTQVYSAPIHPPYAGTGYGWKIVTADIDGDGHPELLIADAGAYVHVLKAVGNDAYAVQPEYEAQINLFPFGHELFGLFVGDSNLDGQPDVVLVMYEYSSADPGASDIYVFNHTGAPGRPGYELIFRAPFDPAPAGLTGLFWSAMGDSDHDGIPDIVIGSTLGRVHPIDRFEWNPALATYVRKQTYPAEGQHGGTALIADVDGDGRDELLYASVVDKSPGLLVYESTGDDAYARSWRDTETLHRGLALAVTTLPGTSLPVIVVPGYDDFATGAGRLYVFAPTGLPGDYANLTPDPIAIPPTVHGVAAGDFDGDGKLDVLIAGFGGPAEVAVYEQE